MIPGERTLTICGGGLAGLALGNAVARHGHAVRVLEKGIYPRHRVCGEFICGVSEQVMRRLGIESEMEDAMPLQSMSWWQQDRRILTDSVSIPARGISRHRLDQRLAKRFTDHGGHLECGRRCQPETQDDEGVVWTAGRPRAPGSPWLGLKCHLLDMELESDLEMHLGAGGYVGLSRIEDGRTNLCGLFQVRPDVRAPMPELLERYLEQLGARRLLERFRRSTTDPESHCAVAGFGMGEQPGPRHLPCIGDAHLMIPPFTGNGMSMAFESADLMATALLPWLRGETDWHAATRTARRQVAQRFRRRMRLARMLHRPLLHPLTQLLTSRMAAGGVLPVQWLFRQLRT